MSNEPKKFHYFCRKHQRILSKDEIRLHSCMNKKKGRNKGRWCSLLIRLPT